MAPRVHTVTKTMLETMTKLVKWASIPVLLSASLFTYCAAGYEPLVDLAVCLGAFFFIQKAVSLKQYFWAGGFLAIAVVFTPMPIVLKLFLLMGITSTATLANLLAAFRPHPAPAN